MRIEAVVTAVEPTVARQRPLLSATSRPACRMNEHEVPIALARLCSPDRLGSAADAARSSLMLALEGGYLTDADRT